MGSFSVNFSETKNTGNQLEKIIICLADMADQVEWVRNSYTAANTVASARIQSRLKKNRADLYALKASISGFRVSLEEIMRLYEETEKSILGSGEREKSEIELKELADAQDKTTKTFDDDKRNGTYGADQGDMAKNKKGLWFFGFRWFEDEDLYAYIRQHSRYQNYSQTEIAALMDQINFEGCGYIAIVNNIFVEYEGREAEFERIFGFPMYNKDGKANYDYLIVDFYANTDDQYYMDEPMGATSLVNDVVLQYLNGREDDFRRKYGCDPLSEGKIPEEVRQKILDEYQDMATVTLDMNGTTRYSLENRFKHYMEQKGIACTSETLTGSPLPDTAKINRYLEDGQNVNIATDGFNLYEENGKAAAKDVGSHWMTATGTTDDGRYIVSSWGKRYYLNPSELDSANFYITDIFP